LVRDLIRRKSELLPKFAAYYQQLRALPRRTRRMLQRRFAPSLAGAALLLALGHGQAIAATINVGGGCSLVNAITAANTDTATGGCSAGSGADTISLPASSTHTLTSVNNSTYGDTGLPIISSEITIEGNSSTVQRDSGAPNFRLLAVSTIGNLTLQHLTLTGGKAVFNGSSTAGAFGGAVSSHGIVALTNSTASGNAADFCGGGMANFGGTLTLNNSTVSGNSVGVHGGGIYNIHRGVVTATDSTISNNTAVGYGGAVYNSTGGGAETVLTLINSTVSGNTAGGSGGGVRQGFPLTLLNSTVSDNRAGVCGGGINAGSLILIHTLVSGNTASSGSEICAGATVNNFNLVGHNGLTNTQAFSGFAPGATDLTATSDGNTPTALTDILDTTLQDNGGPTLTHALITGSPAIDASPVDADCEATDQRGVARPQGVACDIGAFEAMAGVAEVCGNCVDDDGDSLVDLLDPDCQPTDPLAVAKGSFALKPDPNKDVIALKATFPSAGVTLNPPVDGVAISFFDADGSIECFAISPNSAGWKVNRKGTTWSFKDAKDDSLGDPEAAEKVTIKRNDKKGLYEVKVTVKEAELIDPDAGLISSGIVIGDELRANQQEWKSAAKGKKLVTP
jgi:hypothetical protein